MRHQTPSTEDDWHKAPLWQPPNPQPSPNLSVNVAVEGHEVKQQISYNDDISSLALVFVPFPFHAGGATYTMDAIEGPRRFSTSNEERVGLLRALDNPAKQHHYGTTHDPAEVERLLSQEGIVEESSTTAGTEAKLLLKYSIPLMGTYLLQYSFSLVTIFVVGHIGTDELGAVSLATMTANSKPPCLFVSLATNLCIVTGLAVYEGLATSLDTLCAQAYGSGRKTLVGLHLQRMVLFMLLVTSKSCAWSLELT